MSYCVNCGVELGKSEKYCPLCQVEVINPASPWAEPEQLPYPARLERISRNLDRRHLGILLGVILLIPALITLICDLAGGNGIVWSGYVIGALGLLFVWFVLPLYFNRYYHGAFFPLDLIALLGYLFYIEFGSGGDWFLPLGAPLCIISGIFLWVSWLLFTKKKKMNGLGRASWILLACGLFSVAVEIIINSYASGGRQLVWSIYVLIPCLALSLCAFILSESRRLRDEIRKRIFF